jgi:hypothetical protein
MGSGAGGSGAASAGADAAKQGAMKAAMGKASTALAAAGPVGVAVAGAKAAQGAINAVSGRMEQMAGHAGLSNANPYHQAAGAIPQQGQRQGQQSGGGAPRTNQTIAEQQNSSRPPDDPHGTSGATQAERDRPEPTPSGTTYESEEMPERAEPATGPGEQMAAVYQEADSSADYVGEQTPPDLSASQRAAPNAAPATAQHQEPVEAPQPQQGPLPAVEADLPPTAQPRTTDANPQGKEKDR